MRAQAQSASVLLLIYHFQSRLQAYRTTLHSAETETTNHRIVIIDGDGGHQIVVVAVDLFFFNLNRAYAILNNLVSMYLLLCDYIFAACIVTSHSLLSALCIYLLTSHK